MNKERRKKLSEIIGELEAGELSHEEINDIISELEYLHDEEETAFDNLGESLQQTERGQAMETAIDNLDDALSSLEDALDYATDSDDFEDAIDDAISSIEEAMA